ncbi:MAG TPA: hypothetical protein VKV74_11975 [Bryobacteraceae bacterium]|nr:hypothetical protein [Bryobacteraceae bacterium]
MKTKAAVLCGLTFLLTTGALRADVLFYGGTFPSGQFGVLDATTGVFTLTSSGNPNVAGLGWVGGVLYGADYETAGQLYSINPATGSFTPVGSPSGLLYYDFGATTTGLFALLYPTLDLYSIDPATGAATLVGSTGIPIGGASQLSNNSNTLYAENNGILYTINTSTGLASQIGLTGQYDALAASGGVLYGAASAAGTIDTIDPATGNVTVGPSITGAGATETFFGIAPTSPVPEPASIFLLAAAVVAIPFLKRLRAKQG